MPQVLTNPAFWKAVGTYLLKAAVAAAISYGIGRLVGRRAKGALTGSSPLDLRVDPLAPHRVIYGERAVGGVLRFRHAQGTDNSYCYLIIVWAAHECEAITAFKADGVTVNFDSAGNAIGTFAGVMHVTHHLGAHDQAADSYFVSKLGGSGLWTADHRLQGRCYSAIELKYDQAKFPGGPPQFTAVVKGKKCYDWRDASQDVNNYSTWTWSENNAVCLADFLRGCPVLDGAGQLIRPYGIGCGEDQLPAGRWIAEANACDEEIPLAVGGTEKRYTCNGCFDVDTSPPLVLDMLAASMAGKIVPTGAEFIPYAGVWHAPDFTITEDMLRGEPMASNPLPRSDRLNTVKGTYINPAANWQSDDFPQVVLSGFIDEDGGELSKDLDLSFTNSPTMARRIAKIAALRTRQGLVTQWPCNLRAVPAMAGENVMVTSAEFAWTGKPFEVSEFVLSMQKGDDGGVGFAPDVLLQESDPSIFDWSTDEEGTVDAAPNTGSGDPRSVEVPTGLTLNAAGASDRTALPRIRVAIDPSTDPFVLQGGYHQFAYKKSTDSTWVVWSTIPGDDTIDFISDLKVGATYQVRARRRNVYRVWSPWCDPVSVVAPSGLSNYNTTLTNDTHGVACDAEGNALAGELGAGGRAFTDVLAWAGSTGLAPVAASPTDGQFAISVAVLSGTATYTKVDADTVRLDTLGSSSAVIRITVLLEGVLSIDCDFTVVKVTSGGAYWLASDAAAVNRTVLGAYTPATLNFSGWAKLLTGAPQPYAGRFLIETTADGSTWTTFSGSTADETTRAITVPAGIKAIRCRFYRAGGMTQLLDEETIPITSDGATGATGAQGPQGEQGTPGPAGSNGSTTYFHVAYADSADGTVNFNHGGGIYVGTYVDTNPADSSNPAAYTWRLFRGAQGPSGTNGIPGANGADGQTSYLHIKYSNDGGATFTASGGETPGDWLGVYVDFTAADSSNPADYTWKKIVGPTGPQGEPGTPGSSNKVATPVINFSPPSYSSSAISTTCSITCGTSGATIWYQKDGEAPRQYVGGFSLHKLIGIAAWAEKSDMVQSDSTYDMYEDNT